MFLRSERLTRWRVLFFLAVAIAQSPLLLLSADLTLRALAGTSVGVSALTAHGEALAMTKATIAANLHQASNVLPTLTPEVALDEIAIVINAITKTGYFVLSKIANAGVRIDTSLFTNFAGAGATNAVNVGKTNLNALLTRKVYAVDTGQLIAPFLALALLMARVLADHIDLAVATDDLAFVAHLLDRRTYLHRHSSR